MPCKSMLSGTVYFGPFPQDGWTPVLLAARYGHKATVHMLCDTFEADILHRKKASAMQTMTNISKKCFLVHW